MAGARVAVVVEVDVVISGRTRDHRRGDAFTWFTSGVPVAPSDGSILLVRHVLTLPPPDHFFTCNRKKKW